MKTVLILGATGNLGGLAASVLNERYPEVGLRLTSSRESGCDSLRELYPNAEVLGADWYDPSSLVEAMRGVDSVFIVVPDFTTDESIVTPNIISAVKTVGGISQVVRLIAIPPGLTAAQLSPEFLATRCGANLSVIAKPLLDASGLPMTYINVPCWIMFNLPWFLAPEIKARRRLAMPRSSDSSRLWISEADVAEVAAKILAEDPSKHVGEEYVLTGTERIDFVQITKLLGEVIGEEVVFAADDHPLRDAMGDKFDALMTYFRHETRDYGGVPVTNTVARLLGRPQVTLRQYLTTNRDLFI